MDELKNRIIDVYVSLTESGVRFYYEDDINPFSEIKELNSCNEKYLCFTTEEGNKVKVSLEDFRIYHSKENINLYDWVEIREFDRLLEKLNEI
ncbi:hypothetical protein [Clostridium sp.]|uniref:hypothetical protein n=1 Tax=Clostridium sp. TaxID=1506 RepID=UPI0034644595